MKRRVGRLATNITRVSSQSLSHHSRRTRAFERHTRTTTLVSLARRRVRVVRVRRFSLWEKNHDVDVDVDPRLYPRRVG